MPDNHKIASTTRKGLLPKLSGNVAEFLTGIGTWVAAATQAALDAHTTATGTAVHGLGTMSTETATNYLTKAGNLTGIVDAAAARTTLGLGTLATQSGTFSGTSSGTNTGDQTSVSGNAGTATALQTARSLWGNNFDGTAAITGKITASTNGIDVPASAAGTCYSDTYTPTLTNTANLSASAAFLTQFARTGNFVTVAGVVTIDPTAGGTIQLGISLPVASNFGGSENAGGGAHSSGADSSESFVIYADAANDRVVMDGVAVNTANHAVWFHFSYRVI